MDGTFKSSPRIFAQIYSMHVRVMNQFFPVLHAFLPDKTERTYNRLFNELKRTAINVNLVFGPAVVHIDFEMAAINAINRELNIVPTGCLFHFDQNIYRKIQAVGLQVQYNTDNPAGVRQWLRRLMALPLVPPIRLPGVYAAIIQNAPNVPEAAPMHMYMWATYVDPNNALFPVNIWNVFNTVDRTTNICEGWHSALNKDIGVYSPTIYKIINFLQKADAEQEREVAQLALGAAPKRRKAKYVRVDEAIARLTDNTFANGIPTIANILLYLDAVAFQLWDLKH
jgi:MULE transposase domain